MEKLLRFLVPLFQQHGLYEKIIVFQLMPHLPRSLQHWFYVLHLPHLKHQALIGERQFHLFFGFIRHAHQEEVEGEIHCEQDQHHP